VTEHARIIPFPAQRREGVTWEPWVDETKVAKHFGVSTRTVRRWLEAGCPTRLVGRQRRYRLSELEAWHDAQQEGT
jgi:transposase